MVDVAPGRQRRGERLALLENLHDRALEPGPLEEVDGVGQVVGAEDHVDVGRPLLDQLAVLLRQAATHGDLQVGPAALQCLELAEVPVEFVVGVLPDAARVEHDEVGLVGGGGRLHSLPREQPGEALRVVLVHLAPEGPDPEALRRHQYQSTDGCSGHRPLTSEAAGPEIWTAIGDCPRSMSKRRFTAGSLLVPW